MITPTQKIMLAITLLATARIAAALNLGEIQSTTRLGQPLDAYIDLYAAPGERAAPMRASVLPDLFQRDDSELRGILAQIQARVIHTEQGYSYVHLRSGAPMELPALAFRLRLATDAGAILRHYTLSFAPTAQPRPRPIARRATTAAPPQAATIAGAGSYGPVRSGEALWTIAKRLSGGVNTQALVATLHAANPSAFIGGDINRLKVGVVLSVPHTAGASIAPATAPPTAAPQPASLPAAAEDSAAADAPASVAAVPEIPAAGSAVRDAALAARLAALDVKYAAIRAKYATDAATQAAVPTTASAAIAPPAVAPVPAAAAPAEQTRPAQPPPAQAPIATQEVIEKPAPPAGAEPVPAREPAPMTAARWLQPQLLAILLVLLALVLLAHTVRRRSAVSRTRRAVTEHVILEADRKAEIARKAGNRVRMESEIRGLIDKRGAAPAPDLADTLPPAAPEPTTIERAQNQQAADETARAVTTRDPRDIEIDSSIAHGRYAEAERLLLEVIAATPRNYAAKLRLVEVYYITERVTEFGALAMELQSAHRAEISNDEWQRVMRMGKIIAPDLALFSGPRAVNRKV